MKKIVHCSTEKIVKKIVHCSIEKIVKKIVHCSIEKIVKKIVQDGKSALVTQGGLHVLITDTAVLLPVSSSEYNSILSMVGVRAEIKKTICIISTQIIVSG